MINRFLLCVMFSSFFHTTTDSALSAAEKKENSEKVTKETKQEEPKSKQLENKKKEESEKDEETNTETEKNHKSKDQEEPRKNAEETTDVIGKDKKPIWKNLFKKLIEKEQETKNTTTSEDTVSEKKDPIIEDKSTETPPKGRDAAAEEVIERFTEKQDDEIKNRLKPLLCAKKENPDLLCKKEPIYRVDVTNTIKACFAGLTLPGPAQPICQSIISKKNIDEFRKKFKASAAG